MLNQEDIKADGMLLKFCRDFQTLYGNKAVTPNMHFHCHLKDVIPDYGPMHSFWCFSFKRYNRIIGRIVSNNRSIELQLMRKIVTSRQLGEISLCETFKPFFSDIMALFQNTVDHVWQNETGTITFSALLEYFQIPDRIFLSNLSLFPNTYKESILDNDDFRILLDIYKLM